MSRARILRVSQALLVACAIAVIGVSSSAQAAFPGANGKIAFTSNRDGNNEIYIMDADGSNQTRLTNDPGSDSYPRFSPDGRKISFNSDRVGAVAKLFTMNIDGTGVTQVTNNATADANASWSPTNSQFAFDSTRDDQYLDIYKMNIDGSNVVRLTNHQPYDIESAWSPNGQRIVFRRENVFGGGFDLWIMNSDGSGQTQFTSRSNFDFGPPSWAPDGSYVVYDGLAAGNMEIYKIKADGTGDVRLTNSSAREGEPAWSPDGAKIAFTSDRDGNHEIYVMNSDGSGQTRLTNNAATDSGVDWQPVIGTTVSDGGGRITSTIPTINPILDYTVNGNQTVNLDGQLCGVTVASGGVLKGTGRACGVTVAAGGTIAPGHSPGCLTTGNLNLAGSYAVEIAGTVACSDYDQVQVTGSVAVGGALNISLLNGYSPGIGSAYTIISNDGTDPVTGTFTGLAEGATVTAGSTTFKISYAGGDGNDVTLTAVKLPGLPSTGHPLSAIPALLLVIVGGISFGGLVLVAQRIRQ